MVQVSKRAPLIVERRPPFPRTDTRPIAFAGGGVADVVCLKETSLRGGAMTFTGIPKFEMVIVVTRVCNELARVPLEDGGPLYTRVCDIVLTLNT